MALGDWQSALSKYWPALVPVAATVAYVASLRMRGPFLSTKHRLLSLVGYAAPSCQGGHTHPHWDAVRKAFRKHFDHGYELGAQLVVYHKGVEVVNLWGRNECWSHTTAGSASGDIQHRHHHKSCIDLNNDDTAGTGGGAYDADTLTLIFSCGKVLESVAVMVAVDRGLLNYEDAVSKHWPEFSEGSSSGEEEEEVEEGGFSKSVITVADVLRHEAGLAFLDEPITPELASNRKALGTAFARQRQHYPGWCRPSVKDDGGDGTSKPRGREGGTGSKRCYHSLTRGWVLSEIISRVDPQGRSIGEYFEDEVACPLGLTNRILCSTRRRTAESGSSKGNGGSNGHLLRPTPMTTAADCSPHWSAAATACNVLWYIFRASASERATVAEYLAVFGGTGAASDSLGQGHRSEQEERQRQIFCAHHPAVWDRLPSHGLPGFYHEPEGQAIEMTSGNTIATAAALAKVMACLAAGGVIECGVDGGISGSSGSHPARSLCRKETLEMAVGEPVVARDAALFSDTVFTRGGWNLDEEDKESGEVLAGQTGWMGWGGSVLNFNMRHGGVAVSYLVSGMGPDAGDSRAGDLQKAINKCVLALE